MPVATITLVWPAEDPALTDRLPIDSIIHHETYEDYTPDRIDALLHAKGAIRGKQTLCGNQQQRNPRTGLHRPQIYKEANEAISKDDC